ncbi:uncharacterized protein LOC106154977 [Lingula anatina]|uniref:Large ribosomal subunit protein bL9m n=1 Tax=Lingula anatina TaxID=7574 RepID=A0A1S3HG22_LINAN|nr:uncharacterized protein LOC106154977 [Lingula anatina]XP_013385007.1 uncharacterized protein LOC106154977 [Lingula anatina]|eukprot:XP_013385005.1 uncharacterized protein LOC106154977 [Lingula anatina]
MRGLVACRLCSPLFKDIQSLFVTQMKKQSSSSKVNELKSNYLEKLQEKGLGQPSASYVLKRRYPMRLVKKGSVPFFKKKNYVYEEVDKKKMEKNMGKDAKTAPVMEKEPPMPVILTRDVLGLGVKGDLVFMKKNMARLYLLPVGIAVYSTPENRALYPVQTEPEPDPEAEMLRFKTLSTEKMTEFLRKMNLYIPMSAHNDWTLTTKHVRIAFRWHSVVVPEENIQLPAVAITGPNTELQPFDIAVKVKEDIIVNVRSFIQPWYNDKEEYSQEIEAIKELKQKYPPYLKASPEVMELQRERQEKDHTFRHLLHCSPSIFVKEACELALKKHFAELQGKDFKEEPSFKFKIFLERKDHPKWRKVVMSKVMNLPAESL